MPLASAEARRVSGTQANIGVRVCINAWRVLVQIDIGSVTEKALELSQSGCATWRLGVCMENVNLKELISKLTCLQCAGALDRVKNAFIAGFLARATARYLDVIVSWLQARRWTFRLIPNSFTVVAVFL